MRDVDSATAAARDDGDLENLIATRRNAVPTSAPQAQPERMPAKLYGIMAVTTALTFLTLVTGYHLLFPPHQLFA